MRAALAWTVPLFAALPLAATAAEAQVHGFLDARLVSPSGQTSSSEGGLGKTRYGDEDAAGLRLGGVALEGRWQAAPSLLLFAGGRYDLDDEGRAQLIEAYLRWRPVSTSAWRGSVKAGEFFPAISLENEGLGWTSLWTLTPSAINTWVGEELRTFGAEARVERRGEGQTFEAAASAFQMSDPAGELLATRGWALGDHVYGLGGRVREPDVLGVFGYTTPRRYDPFAELDQRIGWTGELTWRAPAYGRVTLLRYDNDAKPTAHAGGAEPVYAWHTHFWSLAAQTQVGPIVLIAQGMQGDTYIDAPYFDSETSFNAGFLLAGWDFAPYRAAVRFDAFSTATDPPSAASEHGNAMTMAFSWRVCEGTRVTSELLRVDSVREERAVTGGDPHATEWQAQLAVRVMF